MDLTALMGPAKYGYDTSQPASAVPSTLSSVPAPSDDGSRAAKPWHPDNPLFAFAAVLALATGLAAFSTSVRVGPAKAGISLGT